MTPGGGHSSRPNSFQGIHPANTTILRVKALAYVGAVCNVGLNKPRCVDKENMFQRLCLCLSRSQWFVAQSDLEACLLTNCRAPTSSRHGWAPESLSLLRPSELAEMNRCQRSSRRSFSSQASSNRNCTRFADKLHTEFRCCEG